jgi:CheY-like chemotaxis protein
MATTRILIVDNQRGIRRSLRSILESLEPAFEIHEATSGEEALLGLARLPGAVDLLITDMRLAGISGLDLSQRLRGRSSGMKVILTASGIDEPVRQRALEAHVNALLSRPVDASELVQAVQRCLGRDSGAEGQAGAEGGTDLGKRLEVLQKGMVALAMLLLDTNGRVLAQAGDGPAIGVPVLSAVLEALGANARLAQALGGDVPDDLLCLAGPKVELFACHIGESYALLALFDPSAGGYTRARVTRLVTSAVQDLAPLLPRIEHLAAKPGDDLKPEAGAEQEQDPTTEAEARQSEDLAVEESLPASTPPDSALVEAASASLADLEAVFQQASLLHFDPTDVDNFWETAVEQQNGDASADPATPSLDQAPNLGLVEDS